jgi:hypothetical protein
MGALRRPAGRPDAVDIDIIRIGIIQTMDEKSLYLILS